MPKNLTQQLVDDVILFANKKIVLEELIGRIVAAVSELDTRVAKLEKK